MGGALATGSPRVPAGDAGPSSRCPVCGSAAAAPFLSLSGIPVHCNVLSDSADQARSVPRGDLDLSFCGVCGHFHNASFDDSRTTYGGSYENSLHHSGVFQRYASALVDELVERHGLHGRDVVEIGAGQGDFLQMLCARGGNRGTGFDPSYVGSAGVSDAVTLVPAFYDERFVDHPVDVVVCRQVLEHIGAASDFVAMVRRVIGARDDVLVLFEVPSALWTIHDGGIWDLIYEHCSYFTPQSLWRVFARNAFSVDRVDPVFDGQFLVLEARPAEGPTALPDTFAADIADLGADVARFAAHYEDQVAMWRRRFEELARAGRRVVIWGAGSKGVTFLNVADRDRVVERAVDLNPRKHGKHIAGTGQQIVGPEALVGEPPDVVVVMNPIYRDEIGATLARLGIDAQLLLA
jgi:hypothetical protein